MISEIFEKYKENFKHFIPYFILSVIIALIIFKFNIPNTQSTGIDSISTFKDLFGKDILKSLSFSLLQVYIIAYGLVIARKIIKGDSIDQKETFSDAISFYPRLLGLNIVFIIIIFLITMAFVFIMMWVPRKLTIAMLVGILFLIGGIVFTIFTSPILSYLVYYDENIGFSIKQGIMIGKKYFFKLLGLLIVAVLVGSLANTNLVKNSMVVLGITTFINSMFMMFLNLYVTNLCKLENGIG